jgi:methylamine dehydrogenase accessory protein MauD
VLEALLVSNLLLWLLVVGMGVVIVALVRQIGVLHERVAPAGALSLASGPKAGEAAPRVEVEDLAGTRRSVGAADPEGLAILLFFLSPTCPVCKVLLPVLESVARRERAWLRVWLASDGPRAEHEAFVKDRRLERFPYLLSTELGLTYRVGRLPYAVLIDAGGVIRAQGLVNSREHLESLFEAAERGVVSVQDYLRRELAGERSADGTVGPETDAAEITSARGAQR